jgi:hypothetical protein
VSYMDQAALSRDGDFAQRIAACGVNEVEAAKANAMQWAAENQWLISSSPGFADKYASAVAGGVPRPGADPSVISDADILSAVQTLFPS